LAVRAKAGCEVIYIGRAARPIIVLSERDRADQAGDGVFVGEGTEDVDAARDLAVKPFPLIDAADLGLWSPTIEATDSLVSSKKRDSALACPSALPAS
jgi:hypothetical protein